MLFRHELRFVTVTLPQFSFKESYNKITKPALTPASRL